MIRAQTKTPLRRHCGPRVRTFLEFFAGAGMATIGLGEGWHCLFANDFDQQKAASYRANHNGGHLLVADVAALTLADLPPGVADLAWASSPCQDVSLAGARAGLDGSRSGACWPWLKLMKGLVAEGRAPRLLVVENVVGLLTSSKGEDFK